MIEDLTPAQVADRLAQPDSPPLLIDVREAWERQRANLDESVHIPLDELPGRISELPRDRDVVVFCHHGNRSRLACGWLAAQGFERLANLAGGIDSWSTTVDPSIERY